MIIIPYVSQDLRDKVDPSVNELIDILDYFATGKGGNWAVLAGIFTYIVYRLLLFFNKKYWNRALGMGCLVMAMMEMYRKEHVSYEDIKIKEAGDVVI